MNVRLVKLLWGLVLLFGSHLLHGQNYPVCSGYPVNLALYNPAEAASDHTYIFINHRQQWTGVEGAPVLSTFNINTLLDQRRVGLGLKASSFARGLITTTDVLGTFAYGIPISKEDALYFGIAGGAISNSLDLTSVRDPSDPALSNFLNNNLHAAPSAGFVYKSASGLNFGVSLPQMIVSGSTEPESFRSATLSPFDQIIVSTYYRKKLSGIATRKVRGMRTRKQVDGYAPLELYLTYKYSAYQTSQFEALVKVNIGQHLWIGGGYRQAYGAVGFAGIAIKDVILHYAFEPGGQPESGFSQGTHEIQLGARLGKEKRLKRKAPVLQSTLQQRTEQRGARLRHTILTPEEEEQQQKKLPSRFYLVVVKAFVDFGQAEELKNTLINQKFNADIYYYAKDRRYYVHVLKATKAGEANEEAKKLKNYTRLKDARVVTINEN